PAAGYPVPVREDGTVMLPDVGPVPVLGLSVAEAREVIRRAYLEKKVQPKEAERAMVTLLHQRSQEVIVFRQEATVMAIDPSGAAFTPNRRGTGHLVELPGYENDVLHALAQTGGLPGLDAYNEVLIFRNCFRDADGRALVLNQLQGPAAGRLPCGLGSPQVGRIP